MKIVVVGAVAGGASAATRARRLAESADIVLFERGTVPSFANCGMPYYVGGEITDRAKLLVTPPERLRRRYHLDLRLQTEVVAIDRARQVVVARDLTTGREYEESYDKLILSPGAAPLRPPLPGSDHPQIYTLRELRDCDRIKAAIDRGATDVLIIGAGFIGLEMAENCVRRNLKTTIVERNQQILPPWDTEMTTTAAAHLRQHQIDLRLGDQVVSYADEAGRVRVSYQSGATQVVDFVILSVGVKPENALAVAAGLEIGTRGGIRVNEYLQTSDPRIYAVGDAIEVRDFVLGEPTQIPLAGPANRQGRLAADHLSDHNPPPYRGTQGTAILRLF
ncbi:MAG: FAD/NAD(P)-binding oxidoreductase [Planctomycetota bacterium]